jgi:hypothetical protein
LAKNVNVFVQPMIYDIVKKRPEDPAAYALKWIQEYIGNRFFTQLKNNLKITSPSPNVVMNNFNLIRPVLIAINKKEKREAESEFLNKFLETSIKSSRFN